MAPAPAVHLFVRRCRPTAQLDEQGNTQNYSSGIYYTIADAVPCHDVLFCSILLQAGDPEAEGPGGGLCGLGPGPAPWIPLAPAWTHGVTHGHRGTQQLRKTH